MPQDETIEVVIARMEAIDAALPEADGVAWFNKLYLEVTRGVREAMASGRFEASRFLGRLDVAFASFYFDAYEAGERGLEGIPRPWAPLFSVRERRDIAPIQFAIAGMNAHINHDLALALLEVSGELGIELERGGPEHRDFERVDQLLVETEDRVKHWYATGFAALIDRTFGRLDDVLAMWSVERARDQAWTAAATLDALAGIPWLRDRYRESLGRIVGFAGRGLLIPTAT